MEAHLEVQQGSIVDFIKDECGDSADIDALLQSLAERLVQFSHEGYLKPITFLGVGGMKIFRNDIYGRLRFPFRADHKFYQKHGLYSAKKSNGKP
jgi:hypothetical protein